MKDIFKSWGPRIKVEMKLRKCQESWKRSLDRHMLIHLGQQYINMALDHSEAL